MTSQPADPQASPTDSCLSDIQTTLISLDFKNVPMLSRYSAWFLKNDRITTIPFTLVAWSCQNVIALVAFGHLNIYNVDLAEDFFSKKQRRSNGYLNTL